jgi:Carbohydrate family 9 binding domain-like
MKATLAVQCCASVLAACLIGVTGLFGQEICKFVPPTASLSVPLVNGSPELNTDPKSDTWKGAASAWIAKDCTRTVDYPKLKTEVRAFWTHEYLYLLFICPYESLNVFLPAQNDKPRPGLWDRDVVEVFLGADWDNIGRYKEYEVAPTGDWIDLDITLDLKTHNTKGNRDWRSGWNTAARIDDTGRIWYAAARIPLKSVTSQVVEAGTKWRANLYRIAGQGPDSQRQFLCWQPTCAPGLDPNHVPENFGTLTFENTTPER